jgi:hypothetical protein
MFAICISYEGFYFLEYAHSVESHNVISQKTGILVTLSGPLCIRSCQTAQETPLPTVSYIVICVSSESRISLSSRYQVRSVLFNNRVKMQSVLMELFSFIYCSDILN